MGGALNLSIVSGLILNPLMPHSNRSHEHINPSREDTSANKMGFKLFYHPSLLHLCMRKSYLGETFPTSKHCRFHCFIESVRV